MNPALLLWTPPSASARQGRFANHPLWAASIGELRTVGPGLAKPDQTKNVFQAHGADAEGRAMFRKTSQDVATSAGVSFFSAFHETRSRSGQAACGPCAFFGCAIFANSDKHVAFRFVYD